MGKPDIVLLYRTLVADGGLPSGYEKEFSTLGPVLESAAQRQDRIRELSNMEASIFLKQRRHRKRGAPKMQRHRRISSFWPRDAASPGSHTYLHGKNARGQAWSTLRSRVRAVRRYLNRLALNHDTGYPSKLEHITGYLQARQSEPRTRNALRGARAAIMFMEEVAGVGQSAMFTGTQVCAIIQREILANTLPGTLSKQAPRMLIGMLSMLIGDGQSLETANSLWEGET